jgi:hypothetical protein
VLRQRVFRGVESGTGQTIFEFYGRFLVFHLYERGAQ